MSLEHKSIAAYSVARCVIPCVCYGKSVKHKFSCRKKSVLFKKKRLQFALLFYVMVNSQSDKTIFGLFRAGKLSTFTWHPN